MFVQTYIGAIYSTFVYATTHKGIGSHLSSTPLTATHTDTAHWHLIMPAHYKYVCIGGGNAAGYVARAFVESGKYKPHELCIIGDEPVSCSSRTAAACWEGTAIHPCFSLMCAPDVKEPDPPSCWCRCHPMSALHFRRHTFGQRASHACRASTHRLAVGACARMRAGTWRMVRAEQLPSACPAGLEPLRHMHALVYWLLLTPVTHPRYEW